MFVEGLRLVSDNANEVRLAAPGAIASTYTLTLPATLPATAGDNLLSVSNTGIMANVSVGEHAINAGKILKSNGSSMSWTSISVNPNIVRLSGTAVSFSSNTNYVLSGVAGTFKLQATTAFNPAALPAISAVNAGSTPTGTQPTSVSVTTTAVANDSLLFTWTADPSVTRLVVANYIDSASGVGNGLFVNVTPVTPTTVTRIELDHDAAQGVAHTKFTALAPNAICFRFSRGLDPTHPLPTITAVPAGGAASVRYDGQCLYATWTPTSTSTAGAASLTLASVKDVLGFTVLNSNVPSLTTVAALTLGSFLVRDISTATRRTYAVPNQTHDVIATFSRSIKQVVMHSASTPAGSVLNTLAGHVLAPAGITYPHTFVTGNAFGTIAHNITVVDDANNLPYTFTPTTTLQPKLRANGFTTTVNKRGQAYTVANGNSDVRMDFTRPVVSGASASASDGTVAFLDVSAGDVRCDYTTPASVGKDTLTFVGVKDDLANDPEPTITFEIANLLADPQFVSWIVEPNAQSYAFAAPVRARARFSTPLSAVSGISVSSGSAPTAVAIVAGAAGAGNTDVEFEWNTSTSTSPVTLTFNGLVSASGQPDVAPTESVSVALLAAPAFSAWSSQALLPSTTYSGASRMRAVFSKTLIVPSGGAVMSVTPSAGSVPGGSVVTVDGGHVVFDYISPASLVGLTFTFSNLQATDGSRAASVIVPAGPAVTSFNTTAAPDTGSNVVIGTANYTFVFTKNLSTAPSITVNGGGSASSIVHATNTVTADITATAATDRVTVDSVNGVDASASAGIVVPVVPAAAISIAQLELASNPGAAISPTSLFLNTPYSLIARFAKDLDVTAANPTASASNGTQPVVTGYASTNGIAFSWTPSVSGATTLTFVGVQDKDKFVSTVGPVGPYTIQATPPPSLLRTVTAKRIVSAPAAFDDPASAPIGYAVPVRVQFDKTLAAAPTPTINGGGSITGSALLVSTAIANDTVEFVATAASGTTQITFPAIGAADGSSATNMVVPFAAHPSIGALVRTERISNPGVEIGGTPVASGAPAKLRLVFPIPTGAGSGVGLATISGFSVSGGNGAVLNQAIESGVNIVFEFVPNQAGSAAITVGLRRDSYGFEYPAVTTTNITVS